MVQEILVGPERPRRWPDEQKMAIVVEAASDLDLRADSAGNQSVSLRE
jgi:hypothetical protein